MEYEKIQIGKFEICIDKEKQYGYFEHNKYGDELSGGLWFENDNLVDFDGVMVLPKDVCKGIKILGYKCDTLQFCE